MSVAARVVIVVDGRAVETVAGRSLGAVLHEACDASFRRTARAAAPRGLFCGMGVCFDCTVTVDGRAGVRACITPVFDGMIVETGTR
jgi:predicted molibdopterin-dependent oxidoreductase YjgC